MNSLTRKEAVNWWLALSPEEKTTHIVQNLGDRNISWDTLSPRQVELLHADVLLREREEQAWKLMENHNVGMNDIGNISSTFSQFYKNDYPFVGIKFSKGEIEYYHSTIKEIESYNFLTKEEVILANAIFEQTQNNFNPNSFVQQVKFVFRVLNIKSVWCE